MTEPNASTEKSNSERPPWLVLLLPLVAVCVLLCVSPNFRVSNDARQTPMGGDFLQEWVGGWIIAQGEQDRLYELEYVQSVQHDPDVVGFTWPEKDYFPMVYPPFYYVILSPLSYVGYAVSMKLWAALSGLALAISGLLWFRFYPPGRRLFRVCFVVAIVFVPLLTSINMGQKSTFLILILTSAYLLLWHGRPFTAGLMFGLIAFKPHLGIVIGVTMLFKRQWSFAAGALLVVVLLVGGSYALYPNLWSEYVKVVAGMDNYVQTGGYQLSDAHSLWGGFQLLLSGVSPTFVKAVVILASLGVVGILWRIMRGQVDVGSPRFARQFAAMVIATVLLSPHFYSYDLAMLLVPMFLIVTSYEPGEWRKRPVDQRLGLVLLALFGLAGLFPQLAGVTRIQPSIVLMVAALWLIGSASVNPKRAFSDLERPVQSSGS